MKNIFRRTENVKVFIGLKKEYYQRDAAYAEAHQLADRSAVFIEPTNTFNKYYSH
jgi:hypothetical protein